MCLGRGTSDADRNRAVPSVALQQESLFTLKGRADESMPRVPKMARGKSFGYAAFIVVPFIYLFIIFFTQSPSLYCEERVLI
jgi:hypothetical protein